MASKEPNLYIVEWTDITSYNSWYHREDAPTAGMTNVSVGWDIDSNRKSLRLVSLMTRDKVMFGSYTIIPRSCITKMTKIVRKK